MPNWKKIIISGSNASLRTVTASVFLATPGATSVGFQGTSSWAHNALTASFVPLSSLRATGSNYQVQYNNNGFLGATSSFQYDAASQQLSLNGPNPYVLQVTTNGTDGIYLGGTVTTFSDTGLYSSNSDQTLVSFDPVSVIYRYSNGFYIYDGGLGIHYLTGSVYISSSLRTDSILNLSNNNTLASYSLPNNTYYYSNQNYTFNNTTNVHSLIGRVLVSSISASSGFTGSLAGTASWSNNTLTASYVNTLNQNVLITGSLTVGATSLGSNENTLVLGPRDNVQEGGQLLLQAPGGTYTSASMWDNYQNRTRLLRGTNASSDAEVTAWNMHTKQMQLPAYNALGAFSGTPVAALGVNSNGDVITIQTGSQAGGSGTTINNNNDNYILTATGIANTIQGESGITFNGTLLDVRATLSVTPGVTTQLFVTNSGVTIGGALTNIHNVTGSVRVLGSITGSLFGTASNALTINTIATGSNSSYHFIFVDSNNVTSTPEQLYTSALISGITANMSTGVITATGLTGSLFGTASWAASASLASSATTVNVISTGSNATYYITMVDSDNFAATPERLFTANPGFLGSIPITANPSTGEITAAGFIGTASWARNSVSASLIGTVRTTTNATHYLTFVDSANGSSTAEQLYTTTVNGLMCNPSNSSITASGGFFGTASWAQSASWAPGSSITFYNGNANASYSNLTTLYVSGSGVTISNPSSGIVSMSISGGGGGSTSPSGPTGSIQFNGNGVFSGSANFKYQYDSSAQDAGRITHVSSLDYSINGYDETSKNSLRLTNDPNNRKQYANIVNMSDKLGANTAATTIFKFKAAGASGGGATIKVLGFKCDYCLALDTGTSKMGGSRVGTLWGSWDWDTGQNPSIAETTIAGDVSFNELTNAIFTLIRNGSDVELQLDTNSVNYNVYYSLLITVFTQTEFT